MQNTIKNVLLTPREIEVLQLLANGLSSQQIADALFITFNTVENHRKHIHAKLGVGSAVAAVAYGFRNKLIV